MSRPVQEAGLFVHGKIHEVEGENVGVEGGHKGEELAERQAGKAIRSSIRRHKLKPYRAAAKAERKSMPPTPSISTRNLCGITRSWRRR